MQGMAFYPPRHKQRQQHECQQGGIVEAGIIKRYAIQHLIDINKEIIPGRNDV